MSNIVVEATNLHKTYPNGVHAVKGIDLQLHKGEVLGLLGPNGAGKTTTMSMLVGILRQSEGEIKILGKDVNQDLDDIKTMIGYSPQHLVFYDFLTCQENAELVATCYGVPNVKSRIKDVFEQFQLVEIANRRAGNLSGGQKRRLNVVLSLLHSPRILFLDEPSAGMDPQCRNLLWDSIEDLVAKEKISIILSTHLMEVADRLAHRIMIIDHGKILVNGTSTELKTKYGGGQILELHFKQDAGTAIIDSVEKQFRTKNSNQVTRYNSTLRISPSSDKSDFHLASAVEVLQAQQAMPCLKDMSFRTSSLEDVFLILTGKALRE